MKKPTTKQNALGSRSPTSFRSASRRSDAPRPPGRRVARPGNDAPPRSALPGLAPLPRFLNRKRPAAKLSQTTPSCALCKWQGWRHAPAHLQWRERQPGAQRGGRGPDPTAAESRREGRLGDGSLSCENKAVITEGPASHRDNRVGTGLQPRERIELDLYSHPSSRSGKDSGKRFHSHSVPGRPQSSARPPCRRRGA